MQGPVPCMYKGDGQGFRVTRTSSKSLVQTLTFRVAVPLVTGPVLDSTTLPAVVRNSTRAIWQVAAMLDTVAEVTLMPLALELPQVTGVSTPGGSGGRGRWWG